MKILLVTRKFPPSIGGMEKYSKELYVALSEVADVTLCAHRRGNRFLLFFLLAAAWRILKSGRRYDVIHFCDGLLAILVPLAHAFSDAAVTVTAHGLDVTFKNPFYQAVVVSQLRKANRVICNSRSTRGLCHQKGVDPGKTVFLPIGTFPSEVRAGVRPARLGEGIESAKMLCTVGRLVKRKGHEWFIRQVMGKLDDLYVYIVAGDGPERANIAHAIDECGLAGRVHMLGEVDESTKDWLLRTSRLFIMPNIPIEGDPEGFGLVLAEAASCGLMAVASDLEGIPDAVVPGETAILVAPLDPEAFASAIETASPDRGRVQAAAASFSWQKIATMYIAEMRKAIVLKELA